MLEKESKTLERKYRDAGIAFVRYTTPGLIILGTGAVAISSAGAMTAAAASVVAVTFVALPIYYLEVVNFNEMNKAAMEKEFDRRRLVLPLTLAPGKPEQAVSSSPWYQVPARSLCAGLPSQVLATPSLRSTSCTISTLRHQLNPPPLINENA